MILVCPSNMQIVHPRNIGNLVAGYTTEPKDVVWEEGEGKPDFLHTNFMHYHSVCNTVPD